MLSDPASHDPSSPQTGKTAGAGRILVVEDDLMIRMMLTDMLVDEGYDVVQAGSGDDALPLLDDSIALLLTDVQLPGGLSGPALVAKVRQCRPDLPVIYTSGRAGGLTVADPRTVAISKPYNGTAICTAIRRLLSA